MQNESSTSDWSEALILAKQELQKAEEAALLKNYLKAVNALTLAFGHLMSADVLLRDKARKS